MRTLSDKEKEIIRALNKFADNNQNLKTGSKFLTDYFFKDKNDYFLTYRGGSEKKKLLFCNVKEKEDKKKAVLSDFFEIMFLFKFLEKNDYLYFISPKEKNDSTFYMMSCQTDYEIKQQDKNKISINDLGDYINLNNADCFDKNGNLKFNPISFDVDSFNYNFLFDALYLTESLRAYVKNNFKTADEFER